MNPLRLSVRLDATTAIRDLDPAIEVFHRFIQQGLVEGLILDVADYRHVQHGPGVLLVGHDIDYGINHTGLTVTRKRSSGDDAGAQFVDLLRMGFGAVDAIAYDGSLNVSLTACCLTVTAFDRRIPRDELVEGVRADVEPVVSKIYGTNAVVRVLNGSDPRRAPQLEVSAPDEIGDLLARLGGSRAPGQSPWDITAEQLAQVRASGDDLVLLDVREPNEYETVHIGGKLMPLATLAEHLDELDRTSHIVAHCRSGHRSAKAVALLRESGFEDAWSLNGGLMNWIDRIDPSLPRY
ncbi:MAG: rhodanese-like domain-containing protein [Actinomycetota bacterium]